MRTHPATGEKALFVNKSCEWEYLSFLSLLSFVLPLPLPIPSSLSQSSTKLISTNSHPQHHRLQERRIRHAPQLPLRTYRLRSRLPSSDPVEAWNGYFLGCEFFPFPFSFPFSFPFHFPFPFSFPFPFPSSSLSSRPLISSFQIFSHL